jgi:hypothetical protein
MLAGWRVYGRAASDLLLMIIYGAVAVLLYSLVNDESLRSSSIHLSKFDLKVAVLFSTSFVFLSGLFISILTAYYIKTFRSSPIKRIAFLIGLYVLNFMFFLIIFSSSLDYSDLSLFFLGVLTIIASGVTNELIWRGFKSRV